jgi:hypothetical protein
MASVDVDATRSQTAMASGPNVDAGAASY